MRVRFQLIPICYYFCSFLSTQNERYRLKQHLNHRSICKRSVRYIADPALPVLGLHSALRLHVGAQYGIDVGLIARAVAFEVVKHVFVELDTDGLFCGWRG